MEYILVGKIILSLPKATISILFFFFLISNVNFIKSAEERNPKKYIQNNSYEIYKGHICKRSSIVGISLR
jgi:hypothetical protein